MLRNAFNNINLQKKYLDAGWLKQDVIANNIANVETPNYKRQKVNFNSVLQSAMNGKGVQLKKTNEKHMDFGALETPYITTDRSYSNRLDGNNVNIDVEMADQAKNSIKYNAMITQVSAQIRRIKSAIKGG